MQTANTACNLHAIYIEIPIFLGRQYERINGLRMDQRRLTDLIRVCLRFVLRGYRARFTPCFSRSVFLRGYRARFTAFTAPP